MLGRAIQGVVASAAIAAGLLLMSAGTVDASRVVRAAGCSVDDSSLDAEEFAFFNQQNSYRAANGLQPLKLSANLMRSASWMARDLASKRYFAHTDSFGRDPSGRAADCGYPGGAGENLAAGTDWDAASEAFAAWKASPGHNQNMLWNAYKVVGVARLYDPNSPYGWYWVTEFGLDDDGTTVTLPGATSEPKPKPQTPANVSLPLVPGANLVTWPGASQLAAGALGDKGSALNVVYSYDKASNTWLRYGPGLPSYLNTLGQLQKGEAYWMIASNAAQISVAP